MDELTVLRDAFGPDPVAGAEARERARTALLERMTADRAAVAGQRPAVHRRRWPLRVALTATAAAAALIGVAAVENLGTVDDTGRGHSAVGLPFPKPASAAEVLQNAAWAAARKPWQDPRPDQFMYNETRELRNEQAYEARHPNAAIVPGRTRTVVDRQWKRVDGQVMATVENGALTVRRPGEGVSWVQVPYADLRALTTPEKVLAWVRAPKSADVDLDALLGQYVLPPDVQAAVFRALARGEGMRLNPDAVNIDGRAAVGLGRVVAGYRGQELLFDRETYALIGERSVAVADHRDDTGDDGPFVVHRGDLFRQVVYAKASIVDRPGDTR
jgi:hypothetical protein